MTNFTFTSLHLGLLNLDESNQAIAQQSNNSHNTFFMIIVLLAIAAVVFWIWSLIDCLKNEPSTGNEKIIWTLVILFAGILGAIIYYFVRRPQRKRDIGLK